MRDYTLTINVTVTDPKALYEAALVRWHEDKNGDNPEEHLLQGGEVNVAGCIQMLGDPGVSWPGTEIQNSACDAD